MELPLNIEVFVYLFFLTIIIRKNKKTKYFVGVQKKLLYSYLGGKATMDLQQKLGDNYTY